MVVLARQFNSKGGAGHEGGGHTLCIVRLHRYHTRLHIQVFLWRLMVIYIIKYVYIYIKCMFNM